MQLISPTQEKGPLTAHLVVQISDVHLTADGKMAHIGESNAYPGPRDTLVAGLELLERSGIRPDAYVLTGDLADAGDAGCYEELATIFDEVAASTGSAVIFLPGNHDDRAAFREHLLKVDVSSGGPINQVHWVDGLRILAIDATIPGEDAGVIDDETFAFIKETLASPAPSGTLIALHHPPIPSPIQEMSECSLQHPERLAEAISGSDVRLILTGHNHHAALGTLDSVPVWTSPSSAFQADMTNQRLFRGVPGSAFSRIDIDEHGVSASVFPISAS